MQPRKPTNDAEAICTAVLQPTMRFVPVKSEVQQAVLMQHRTRDFLVRQLTNPPTRSVPVWGSSAWSFPRASTIWVVFLPKPGEPSCG